MKQALLACCWAAGLLACAPPAAALPHRRGRVLRGVPFTGANQVALQWPRALQQAGELFPADIIVLYKFAGAVPSPTVGRAVLAMIGSPGFAVEHATKVRVASSRFLSSRPLLAHPLLLGWFRPSP